MPVIELSDELMVASQRVIDALASTADVDPLELTTPLYEVVDPDALDALLDTDVPVEIRFEYEGHAVVVDSGGRVSVDGTLFGPDSGSAQLQ